MHAEIDSRSYAKDRTTCICIVRTSGTLMRPPKGFGEARHESNVLQTWRLGEPNHVPTKEDMYTCEHESIKRNKHASS
jgi:hypothetical protein